MGQMATYRMPQQEGDESLGGREEGDGLRCLPTPAASSSPDSSKLAGVVVGAVVEAARSSSRKHRSIWVTKPRTKTHRGKTVVWIWCLMSVVEENRGGRRRGGEGSWVGLMGIGICVLTVVPIVAWWRQVREV
jgi:hypothetical protein